VIKDSPIIQAELKQLLELINKKEQELGRKLDNKEREQFIITIIENNNKELREEAIAEVHMLALKRKLTDLAHHTSINPVHSNHKKSE